MTLYKSLLHISCHIFPCFVWRQSELKYKHFFLTDMKEICLRLQIKYACYFEFNRPHELTLNFNIIVSYSEQNSVKLLHNLLETNRSNNLLFYKQYSTFFFQIRPFVQVCIKASMKLVQIRIIIKSIGQLHKRPVLCN